jgi:hypothetical protein
VKILSNSRHLTLWQGSEKSLALVSSTLLFLSPKIFSSMMMTMKSISLETDNSSSHVDVVKDSVQSITLLDSKCRPDNGRIGQRISSSKNRKRIQLVVKRALFGIQYVTHFLTLLSLGVYLSTRLCHYHWTVTMRPLLARHRWDDDEQKALAQTYYDRDCDQSDISTFNFTDLIVQPMWDSTKAAENILTHGVSIFPNLIDQRTAEYFRNFTLERNLGLSEDDLVFVMNTHTKQKQTRWAFAFTAHDHPSVPLVLKQVVGNDRLRQTLELFLGPDPAMIKMQTITATYKAEPQGWHPDVNAKASVKSHARTFMPHFSLFIALQDTTFNMGSTGVCPGSQYCTTIKNTDFSCGQVFSGVDSKGTPIWFAGDAILMNQNTWHRGWTYTPPKGPDRAIIVLTFTSRPRVSNGRIPNDPMSTPLPRLQLSQPKGCNVHDNFTETGNDKLCRAGISNISMVSSVDAKNFPLQSWEDENKLIHAETRSLSLGTPLTSFGHTMEDMRDPIVRFSTFLTTLRLLGIYKPPNANWGWTFVASLFSRISTETHKFKKEDLKHWLSRQHRNYRYDTLNEHPVKFVLHCIRRWYIRHVVVGNVPAPDPERGIWDVWYTLSLTKATNHFQTILFWIFAGHLLVCLLLSWIISSSPSSGRLVDDAVDDADRGKSHKRVVQSRLRPHSGLVRHALYIVLILAGFNWFFLSSTPIRDIQSGQRIRSPFPQSPSSYSTGKNKAISLIPMKGVRRITHGRRVVESTTPNRNDVLIGTRFDSLYLRIINRFFDYHTGNKRWRGLIRDYAETTHREGYSSLSLLLQNAIAESVVRMVDGRFLLQTPEYGTFVALTAEESVKYTRRAILIETSTLLFVLEQTSSFIISQLRFESTLRTTSLSSICVGYLEGLREQIYGEHQILQSGKTFMISPKINLPLRRVISTFHSKKSLSITSLRKLTAPAGSARLPEHIAAIKIHGKKSKSVLGIRASMNYRSRDRTTKGTPNGNRIMELNKMRRESTSNRRSKGSFSLA